MELERKLQIAGYANLTTNIFIEAALYRIYDGSPEQMLRALLIFAALASVQGALWGARLVATKRLTWL